MLKMNFIFIFYEILLLSLLTVSVSYSQVGFFTRDELIKYTSEWKGERFPDGRPRVPDDIIERMKKVSLEEAWGYLKSKGYNNQFECGWIMTHENPLLVGRAVTSQFMPLRPDILEVTVADGKAKGFGQGDPKHWMMDTLVKDDVAVADQYGKMSKSAFIGDRLATELYQKTGTGVVVDGHTRDLAGVLQLPDFYVFTRSWDPTSGDEIMLVSVNTPIMIGNAVVMPGDVVLGLREGVIFIPSHLAQGVVEDSEITRLQDEFVHQRSMEGKYTSGEIDGEWTPVMEKDFTGWLKERQKKGDLTSFQIDYIKKRK